MAFITGVAPLLIYCLKFLLMNCSKFIITSCSMSGLSMCRAANCDKDARNRLGAGCLYTLFIISDNSSWVSSLKLLHSCWDNNPLKTALTISLPRAAPLPSSPRMNPSGRVSRCQVYTPILLCFRIRRGMPPLCRFLLLLPHFCGIRFSAFGR